jgi:hypothetical protein
LKNICNTCVKSDEINYIKLANFELQLIITLHGIPILTKSAKTEKIQIMQPEVPSHINSHDDFKASKAA